MQWHLFVIAKPKLVFARAGIEEYAKRLAPVAPLTIEYLKPGGNESAALLKRSEGMYRVALDERGEPLTSRAFAARISHWEQQRLKSVAFLIGGADGHTPALRAAADFTWSLSPLSFQHELALVVVLEQLYRAFSIKSGHPYHRD